MELQQLAKELWSEDTKRDAVVRLRKLLSADEFPPHEATLELDPPVLPVMCEMMKGNDQEMQVEASWVVTNLLSGTDMGKPVLMGGVLGPLRDLLHSEKDAIFEQAAWAFGNLTGEGPALRDLALHGGVLELLIDRGLAEDTSVHLRGHCSWVISNCARGKPPPPPEMHEKMLDWVEAAATGNYRVDDETSTNLLWTLAYIADSLPGAVARRPLLLALTLERLEKKWQLAGLEPALRVLGSLAAANDDMPLTRAITAGLCPAISRVGTWLVQALGRNPSSASISRALSEVGLLVGNVLAGTPDQARAGLDSGFLDVALEILSTYDTSPAAAKEAAFAIVNAILDRPVEVLARVLGPELVEWVPAQLAVVRGEGGSLLETLRMRTELFDMLPAQRDTKRGAELMAVIEGKALPTGGRVDCCFEESD